MTTYGQVNLIGREDFSKNETQNILVTLLIFITNFIDLSPSSNETYSVDYRQALKCGMLLIGQSSSYIHAHCSFAAILNYKG